MLRGAREVGAVGARRTGAELLEATRAVEVVGGERVERAVGAAAVDTSKQWSAKRGARRERDGVLETDGRRHRVPSGATARRTLPRGS